jgi:hypothetical protein
VSSSDSEDESAPVVLPSVETQTQIAAATAMATQPRLPADKEQVLALAGVKYLEEIRTLPQYDSHLNLHQRARSVSISSSLLPELTSDLESRASPTKTESLGELAYKQVLATAEQETIDAVEAEPSEVEEPGVVVNVVQTAPTASVLQNVTVTKQEVTTVSSTSSAASSNVSPKTIPTPRAARKFEIDENYGDFEEE